MLFERIESRGLAHYSYIVGDAAEAVVIDPRRDADIYIELALDAGVHITQVLETHRHEDFAVGSLELARRTGAALWHADGQLPYAYGEAVQDGQMWRVGSLALQARHTPGHTEGGMSYVLHESSGKPWMVFSGDTLMTGEVGRVDFLGMGHAPQMAASLYDSIFQQLLPLGDGVILCPAHGYGSACGSAIADRPWSTLGLERALSPRLQLADREAFVAQVARSLPVPLYFERMEEWNLAGPPLLSGLPVPQALSAAQFAQEAENAVVLDLRSMEAFAGAHIPGALSMELERLPSLIGWFVAGDKPLLLLTEGNGVSTAVSYLIRQGYDRVAGYLAGGIRAWQMAAYPTASLGLTTVEQLSWALEAEDAGVLLDVREPEELAVGSLPAAVHVPLKQLAERLEEVPRTPGIMAYCGSGPRSAAAASILANAGYENVSVLLGGIAAWRKAGQPLV